MASGFRIRYKSIVHKHEGVGFGFMKYRATSIGGALVVECTVREIPHRALYKG